MSHISLRVSSSVKEKYTMLSEGTYDFEINTVELGTSRAGNPLLTIRSTVLDGPSGLGRPSTLWLSMVETASWRIVQLLDACGIDYKKNEISQGIFDLDFDPSSLEGTRFRCDVAHKDFSGKTMEDFRSFRSVVDEFLPEEPQPQQATAPNQTLAPSNLARRRRSIAES